MTSRNRKEKHTTKPACHQLRPFYRPISEEERVGRKEENQKQMSTESNSHSDFIKSVYGRPVIIGLSSGVVYKGIVLYPLLTSRYSGQS